jgi:hypothetical protein
MPDRRQAKGPEKAERACAALATRTRTRLKSLQEGAHLTAIGCMLAIRNPATHETGDANPITCAEQPATPSMVARFVRNWTLERYIGPIDTSTNPLLSEACQELPRQQRPAVRPSQQQRSAHPQGTPAINAARPGQPETDGL